MDKLGRQFKTACTVQENIEMTGIYYHSFKNKLKKHKFK